MTSPLLHDIIQTDEYDCRYIMSVKIDPPSEVDLLVAGAGPAGMAAALVASLEGLDVLLCEKSDQVGGTGSTSAGTLWIPGNSQSRAAGYSDSAEQADRYLTALIGEGTNRGKPIPGLYACGNDMASVMAGSYPGPGTTLGPAIVFAYRAVMHAKGSSP